MCGIVGSVMFDEEPDIAKLKHAVSLIQHRGPDDSDVHVVGNVGFGHARLSIIDIDGGRQPLSDVQGNLHLVANGEIYNHIEIAKSCQNISQKALSRSDSEAILQVYQQQGCDGFASLNGMFAFALHDQCESLVILARDRLGIKPLFFIKTAEGVFFASEIKALLSLLPKAPEIREGALSQFLHCQFNTGRETIFKGIQRVLPGEYIVIKDKELRFYSYWSLTKLKPSRFCLDEALDEFDSLFEQVMTEHMRSDVPFGLFLSGGIDSSIILAKLSQLHDQPINTYSIGYADTKMASELDGAASLAKRFGTNHFAMEVTKDQLFQRIVRSIWSADDLMRDYACLPTLMLAEEASKEVKVVFSGEGGDEAFAGYRRYEPHLAKRIYHDFLKKPIRVKSQWNTNIYKAVFSSRLKSINYGSEFEQLWNICPKSWTTMQKRQFVDLNAALVDNLFVKTDRMTMACGLEGRVPLSDHRIVEFGLSLPDHIKYQHGRGKWILRKWAEKYLPLDHLSKPKSGFYVPVNEWLTSEFLKQLEQKLLANSAIQYWFNVEGIRRTFSSHMKGNNHSREIWGLMQFAIWHRLFVDRIVVIPTTNENPLDWI